MHCRLHVFQLVYLWHASWTPASTGQLQQWPCSLQCHVNFALHLAAYRVYLTGPRCGYRHLHFKGHALCLWVTPQSADSHAQQPSCHATHLDIHLHKAVLGIEAVQ